jgi:hypothetical protein
LDGTVEADAGDDMIGSRSRAGLASRTTTIRPPLCFSGSEAL